MPVWTNWTKSKVADEPRSTARRASRFTDIASPMMLVDDAGLWCEVSGAACNGRAALFLDRDGVVVEDTHYLGTAERTRLIGGAAAAIGQCNRLNIPVVIVTNQSGIARGFYDWNGFHEVQAALMAALETEGARIDAALACAYHRDGQPPYRHDDHFWRKPNPGMIIEAGRRLDIALSHSFVVGDRADDIASGRAAGLAGGVLVLTGQGKNQIEAARALAEPVFTVDVAANLAAALALLTESGRLGG